MLILVTDRFLEPLPFSSVYSVLESSFRVWCTDTGTRRAWRGLLNFKLQDICSDDLISVSSVFVFIDGYGITRQMLCAGVPGTRLGGCHGDSGGPFVCKDSDGFWVLQGAVSWGSTDCNAQRMFTVFARVAVFREWINQYVKSWALYFFTEIKVIMRIKSQHCLAIVLYWLIGHRLHQRSMHVMAYVTVYFGFPMAYCC